MIRKAAEFAARAHMGALRKGSGIPYIYHPMEVALIVARMTDDPEVIAAAYLHDVLEDTEVTAQQLGEQFGDRVLGLVQAETEDKSLCWKERKLATITRLRTAERDVKLIALGDKLSNVRATARDYMVMGDEIWKRFHEKSRDMHRWYLNGVIGELQEFENQMAYQELKELYRFVYGENPGREGKSQAKKE